MRKNYPLSSVGDAFILHADNNAPLVEMDCACPDVAFRLQNDISVKDGLFKQTQDVLTAPLPQGFMLAFSPYAEGGPVVLSPAAFTRWRTFEQPHQTTLPIDEQLIQHRLLHSADHPLNPTPSSPQTLTTWLHISNACNLDCPYCYVRKSSAHLSLEVGLDALKKIFSTARKHRFRRVKLKYAGGEALLHWRLIVALHAHAQSLAREYDIALSAVVLSNGVLIRPKHVHWLKQNGVKLMISLDGVGALHNAMRPTKNGRSIDVFGQIEKNVDELLLPNGIKPDMTMTVTGRNAHGAANVAQWAIVERGLPLSFNFYRENDQSASYETLQVTEQAFIDGMLSAYRVIESALPTRPFIDGLLDHVQSQAHTHTCGVGQSYLVINHVGSLAQCQMHLDEPVSESLSADLLIPVKNGRIRNLPVDQKEGCKTCPIRYRCTGGCPLETYRYTRRWDVQSPNCRLYRTLYPAALRLEGLRLMKVNRLLE